MSLSLFKIGIEYHEKDEPEFSVSRPEREISEREERHIRSDIDCLQEDLNEEYSPWTEPRIVRVEVFSDHLDLYIKWCREEDIDIINNSIDKWIGRDEPDTVECDDGLILVYENPYGRPVKGWNYFGDI